jgi:hypothetical protein
MEAGTAGRTNLAEKKKMGQKGIYNEIYILFLNATKTAMKSE